MILISTNDPNFYRYTNGRFGFTIKVPSDLIYASFPTNGDGCNFQSYDGRVVLSVSGMNWFDSLESLYHSFDNEIANAVNPNPYSARGENWFVRTWCDRNGSAHYVKYFVDKKMKNSFHFSYPSKYKVTYSPIIDVIEADFRPGWRNR